MKRVVVRVSDNYSIDSTEIHYSIDSGLKWERIIATRGNDGNHIWNTPNKPTKQLSFKVICYDPSGLSGQDIIKDTSLTDLNLIHLYLPAD